MLSLYVSFSLYALTSPHSILAASARLDSWNIPETQIFFFGGGTQRSRVSSAVMHLVIVTEMQLQVWWELHDHFQNQIWIWSAHVHVQMSSCTCMANYVLGCCQSAALATVAETAQGFKDTWHLHNCHSSNGLTINSRLLADCTKLYTADWDRFR